MSYWNPSKLNELRVGKTCYFYGKMDGKTILKEGVVVGPRHPEFPGYTGIRDMTRGGFCYIEESRLFYSLDRIPAQSCQNEKSGHWDKEPAKSYGKIRIS